MKKLFTLLLCFVCFAHAQNNLSFEELKSSTKRPRGKIVSYVASNGETYLLEDKIVFPPLVLDAEYYSSISQNGFVIRRNLAGTNTWITSLHLNSNNKRGFYVVANCRSNQDFFEIDIEKAIEEDIFNHSEMVRRRDTAKSDVTQFDSRDSQKDQGKYQYCQLMGIGRFMSNKITVTIDYGQEKKFFSPEDQRIKNESTGKAQKFNSMVDAMNYMGENGWEFVQAYVIKVSNQNVYHYLLKKKK